jgi:hypothetical protein
MGAIVVSFATPEIYTAPRRKVCDGEASNKDKDLFYGIGIEKSETYI